MIPLLSLAAGLLTWSFVEYALHRWVFHQRKLGVALARDHGRHHAEVDWFAPWSKKIVVAAVLFPTLTALTAPIFGAAVAAPYLAGVLGGGLGYDLLHRRIHVRAPLNGYGRWARRHHLRHHFGSPSKNHGVTSPIWDLVFGTYDPAPEVVVPKRHAPKFGWLLEDGEIAPAFADTYRLGR